MEITFFGHSAFQIETGDIVIQVDPFITGNPLAEPIVSADELKAHAILVTHAHGDHFGDTISIAKRTGAVVVGNFEITQYVSEKFGHANVQALNTGGGWDFGWGRVTQTWARHSSSFADGTYGGNPGGYMIEAEGKCIYAAGDTSPFAEMAWLGEDFSIDIALLPIGDCFTMGFKGSLRAASMLGAGRYIPLHYNTFPPIEVDTSEWSRLMREAGHEPLVLAPGEKASL